MTVNSQEKRMQLFGKKRNGWGLAFAGFCRFAAVREVRRVPTATGIFSSLLIVSWSPFAASPGDKHRRAPGIGAIAIRCADPRRKSV